MQTFRVLGILFLFFWWIGTLPTVFAWVAALGDVAVGVMAIPATIAVARQTPGWQAKVRWLTVAGLADFAILLVIAVLSQEGRILHVLGDPVAMEAMPLIMIPAFLVPNFILLLLLQWQRARS